MTVTNLQAWADNLELIKLPLIDSQIEALTDLQSTYNDLLSAKIQEFLDKFAQHSARITASQARADDAKDTANSALTQIYQTGLDAHTYIDARIQSLRDELNLSLSATQDYVDGSFSNDITVQIDSRINAALTLLAPIAAEVEAVRASMLADLADIQAVSAEILDQGLPTQAVLINQINEEIQNVKAQAELTLAGFEYDTFIQALDDTQSKIAESLVPLGVSFLQEPAAAWTGESSSAVLSPKNPIPVTWLIANDPTLGACAELPLGTNQTIGQAYALDFSAERVYQVRARIRVVAGGSSDGVRLKLGVSTWASGAAAQLNVEKELTVAPIPAGTTDHIYSCVFSGNLTKLVAQDYIVGLTASNTAVHLTGSTAANKAFFHIRQNSAATTNGQIRVAMLEVKDITDAIDAAKVIKTQLQTQLDQVSASLETINFAVSDLNSAVAGINTKLNSQSIPNLVGDAPFSFPIVDYYVPSLGATLSLVTHGQTGPLNVKALRATDSADGNAGFFTLPYPSGNFTNRQFRFRGKARGSENGMLLKGSTWLYRLGAPDTLTDGPLLTLTTTFQPFDVIIKALSTNNLDSSEVRLRVFHTGGAIGSWSEVTDMEIFDVTDAETANAAIQATLNLLYYTRTQTDSAISEGITTYGAQFYNPVSGQMKASALTDYYTKTTTDSAISSAINSFEAEFRDTTSGQIKATALGSYYTKADTDGAIASASTTLSAATAAKGRVIYSATAPVAADQLTQNLWIDLTGAANTPKRWNGTAWVSVTDKAAADAVAALGTSVNANLSTNYYTQTQTNSAISSASTTLSSSIATAQASADGKGKIIYSTTAPATADRLTQNLWIDLTNGTNTPKRWNGTAWVAVSDTGPSAAVAANIDTNFYTKTAADSAIAAGITNYNATLISPTGYAGMLNATLTNNYYTKTATDTAISSASTTLSSATAAKGKIIYSATSPLAADQQTQNLWIDTNASNNTPKRWNGTAWIPVTDKVATDAAAAVVTTNATLTTDYYTKTAADSAISAANLTLSAKIDAAKLALPLDQWKSLGGKSIVTLTDGIVGQTALRLDGLAGVPNQGTYIQIDRTKTYRVIFWARPSANNTAGLLYFSLRQFLANGSAGPVSSGYTPYKPVAQSPAQHITQFGNTWGKYSFDWNTSDWQVGATQVRPEFLNNWPVGAAGYWDIQGFEIVDVSEVKTETGLISADLSNNYYTKTTANSAIATADTSLKSTLEAPTGSIGLAQAAATAASTLAGGKGKVLYQSSVPAVADRATQNLWIDTTGQANTPKRWDGTAWVVVTDKVATDAATAAAAAATSVTNLSATLTSSYYTKTAADSAIAAADTLLKTAIENPNGTSLGATVKTQASTIATLTNNAAALYSLRVKAGTAAAQLELVASSTPTGAVSQARIDADSIILDGTVTAQHIRAGTIVTDRLAFGSNANMLNNTNFKQGSIGWQEANSDATMDAQVTMAIRNAGESWAGTSYPTLFLVQSGAYAVGYSDIRSVQTNNAGAALSYRDVPVTPGTYYTASAQVSTHRCTGSVIIVFFDSAGTQVGAYSTPVANNASSSTNPDVWPQYWIKALAPATAAFASIFIRKNGTLAPEANSYLFLHKPLIVMSHAGATEAPEYSNGVSTFINGSSIRTGSITAASGAIGDLAVNTLQIAGQAVTVFNIAANGAVTHLPNAGYWIELCGVGISRTAGYGTLVTFNYAVSRQMKFEIYAVVNQSPWVNLTSLDNNNWTTATLWDGDTSGTWQAYRLWARATYVPGYYQDVYFGGQPTGAQRYVQPTWNNIYISSSSISAVQLKR